jgi:uncharacterized repeat protein (TIGR01451 family)
MVADRTVAAPGDLVTFTIEISNIPTKTKLVTVDDSVPTGLRIDSSSEPSGCARANATWSCDPGVETSLVIRLTTFVEESARGKELINRAVIDTDSRQRGDDHEDEDEGEHDSDDGDGGGPDPITVEAGVRIIASDLRIRLVATQSEARPGEPINYRIEVVNDGAGPAVDASVTARLPAGVTSGSVYPRATAVAGDRLTWYLSQIPVGSHVFLLNASFAPTAIVAHVLASASVSYIDSNGDTPQLLEAVLALPVASDPPTAPSSPEASLPLGAVGLMLAAAAGGLLLVQRFVLSPRAPRLGIDQMFLLHRSGLLMKHFSAHLGGGDPDIQGAMLTAVQSYLETSVDSSAGPLRQITFGGRDIIFANGGNAILAAVIRKGDPAVFFAKAPAFLADLDARSGPALVNWDGVADRLEGMDDAFRDFTKGLLAHRGT